MKTYASSSNGILHITILAGILGAVALLLSRRPEAFVLVAAPAVALMLLNYRAATVITTAVLLVWLSRVLVVFYDFVFFSYAVYACTGLTLAAYVLRFAAPGRFRLRLVTNPWMWLFIGALLIAGIRGAAHVDGIPPWLLTGDNVDYSTPWVYFRSVAMPAMFLPIAAIFIAAAVQDGQKLTPFVVSMCTYAWTIGFLIVTDVALSGQSLLTMAQADERYEHLTTLGFHSNEFGTMLAIAYAVLLGTRDGVQSRRGRAAISLTLAMTATALILTFSRGAYVAFAVTNVLFFMRASAGRKAALVTLVLLMWVVAPAAIVDRTKYALDSQDPNTISAGRLDNIWLPILPDIKDHLFFGQGLQSIMWTDAQRFQLIYPVNMAHSAYLDLLLDFGLIGSLPILAWYAYVWRGFIRQAQFDEDEGFRRFFYGGHLALVSLSLCALTNDRLSPSATTAFVWIAAGVLIGRQSVHDTRTATMQSPIEETVPQTRWFRMNRIPRRRAVSTI
jgi:hypothetical protein